jgi:electron transport complex protein RnfG
MSTVQTIHTAAPANSKKMLLTMVGLGILCAFLIVVTFEGTLPLIEKNKAEALEKAIFKVLPGIVKKKAFQLDENSNFIDISDADNKGQLVFAGYDENDNLVGVAVEASGLGFADVLRVLYGYSPDKQAIVGFNVLESKETPGLGDKIEKDLNFLKNFEALDVSLTEDKSGLKNKIVPVKHGSKENAWEIDGITGATISSRAIGNIIGVSTENWIPTIYKNKNILLQKNEKEAQ